MENETLSNPIKQCNVLIDVDSEYCHNISDDSIEMVAGGPQVENNISKIQFPCIIFFFNLNYL